MIHVVGASTDPCGSPSEKTLGFLMAPCQLTKARLSDRNDLIQRVKHDGMPIRASLAMRPLRQTRSYARTREVGKQEGRTAGGLLSLQTIKNVLDGRGNLLLSGTATPEASLRWVEEMARFDEARQALVHESLGQLR